MYDLIVVKQPNKKKIVIVIVIIVLVLLLVTGIFIYNNVRKQNKNVNIAKNEEEKEIIEDKSTEDINVFEATKDESNKQKHNGSINFLPNYTESANEKINNIYRSSEKVVYLTFDDGPSQSVTPLILDLLKQENIKATFFVLGRRVEANPQLLIREYKEGHYIANHGYSHIYKDIYSSPQAVLDEYYKTQSIIKNVLQIEYDGHLFRFPGGAVGGKYRDIKNEAKELLHQNNISYIDWNALSQDAAGAKTKEALIDNIKKTVGSKNSVVILMHDAADKILTYETLHDIIFYLREQGYSFKNFYDIMK